MRALSLVFLVAATPALAEVTHSVEGRFGVSYNSDPNHRGQSQVLYQGRYTTTFTERTDNGLTFRFELGVAVGNFDTPPNRVYEPTPRNVSVEYSAN